MAGTRTERPRTPEPNCPECGDLGWKIKDDAGAGTAVRCSCRKGKQGTQYLAQAGIPERYRGCRFDDFNTRTSNPVTSRRLRKALEISRRYVDNFFDEETAEMRESGLIFIGNPGAGKTHLAAAVLTEVIERFEVCGRFVDFTHLLHRLQSTFNSDSTESKQAVLDPVIKTDLVVLDELGAQKSTEWVMNTLYLIINSRYTAGRPTLFTTNYIFGDLTRPSPETLSSSPPPHSDEYAASVQSGKTPKNPVRDDLTFGKDAKLLVTRISPQLVSRLQEMASPITLDVPDFRLRKTPRHELAPRR